MATAAAITLCWAPTVAAQATGQKPDVASLRGRSSFTWTQPELEFGFAHWDEIVPARIVQAGGVVRTLPQGKPIAALAAGTPEALALDQYIAEQYVAGVIVLQDGAVRLERYARGYAKDGRWMSQSVAKSVTSTLIGVAQQDGLIKSLDDPVTRYITDLRNSAYDSVTIRQLLTMTSGVRWNETYADSTSDIARFYREPVTPGLDATVSYMRRLPRDAAPGTKWVYKSGETHLLGVLVAAATGKPISEYLSETIWKPYGMQQAASWSLDRTRHELAGCCLQASLRDFARFGQFVLDGGRIGSRRIVPEGWFEAATRAQVAVPPGRPGSGYGYQWWTADDGTFSAVGIHGQLIHIDPARRLVVAMNAAWPEAVSAERAAARRAILLMLARVLDAEKSTRPALPAFGQTPSAPESLTVTVSLKHVQVVLPVGRSDLWRWRLPVTPDNQREFAWEVVLGSAEDRGFGFYLFKFPGSPTGSGNLAALLRAGQHGVWQRTSAHMERMVSQGRIVLSPADSGVTVSITDPWTIDFLFGGRPAVGVLRLQNPGRDLTRIPMRFEYLP